MTHTNTEQPEALLPCPFCGDHAETDYIPEHHSYAIECHSMGCAARVIKETADDAIAAWNRRQPVARTPLTRKEINECSRDAQIAFCIDKHPTYEVAMVREVELRLGITQEK